MTSRTQRASTQRDVAALAGVSVATVSYVASGRRDRKNAATPEIRDRVLEAMAKLNYRPQRAGRVLRNNRTGLLAVAAYTPLNPWALTMITQIEEVAGQHKMGTVIVRYAPDTVDRAESLVADGIADAIVILVDALFDQERAERIASAGAPVLAVGVGLEPTLFDVLIQNEYEAVAEAAQHLYDVGSRRPVYITNTIKKDAPNIRRQAFLDTFAANGVANEEIGQAVVAQDTYTNLRIHQIAIELLSLPPDKRPDAIMVGSDRGAITTMWAAIQLGLRIPDDIMIIGAGNIPDAIEVSPQLTTVGCADTNCRPAIERLISRIDNPDLPCEELVVPWHLILRGTA